MWKALYKSKSRLARMYAAIGLAALASLIAISPARAGEITVFAAASVKNAMDEVALGFETETGHQVVLSLAASSALARQIQLGAPADIFISANRDWMAVLEQGGFIDPSTRFDLAGNALVLVSDQKPTGDPPTITGGMDLVGMLGEGRLALAMVNAVPAGIYAKAALVSLGLWEQISERTAQVDNVRAALALISLGEAPLGIVYASDAQADKGVHVVGTFPASSHPPIVYQAAAVDASSNPLNAPFLQFLRGPAGTTAFARQGFLQPDR